ncbi:MAG TPA: hypothetical protein VNK95_07785, partial [Caldilineaceae bacterium]|nr:hypothetical protein [Caldilineaceae bacterium]
PLLAHLQDAPAAPTLADVLTAETGDMERKDEVQEEDEAATAGPTASSGSGLNAADFAAFLQRRKQAPPPGEE